MKKIYGNAPKLVAELKCESEEMFFYQYLPIRMVDKGSAILLPNQLEFLRDLVNEAAKDFINEFGSEEYYKSYMYLTAKRLYVRTGKNLNREGWHSDGFGTNDINYIWCDSVPTLYFDEKIENIPTECSAVLNLFDDLGFEAFLKKETKTIKTNALYRLDETVIHSVAYYIGEPIIRTFVKVSFSRDKYNLKGNSHNYLFDYEWEMKDRELERNHPSKM